MKNYKDPIIYRYDGKEIIKIDAITLMKKAGVDLNVRRCTMWQLLQENAQKGDPRAVELLRHLERIDTRENNN